MAKTTSTINGKTTKTGLIAFLSDSLKKVTDTNLRQRMDYTLKKAKKDPEGTAKSDLYDLAKEVMALLSAPSATPILAVENSTKPKLGKKSKKVEELIEQQEAEDAEAEAEEEEEEETPAPAPKKGNKKISKSKDKKKAEVETTAGLTKKELPMAKVFPKEIDHEALGHLVAVPDKYHTIEEIREALKEEKDLIFAAYWTKRHLKEFAYGSAHQVPIPKNGFPYDLDTLQTLYVCEGIDRIYAMSTYTEAMFRFDPEDLIPVECEANDGSKFMMRYSAGLEYEIYEIVE